jgi:hypothetical protein
MSDARRTLARRIVELFDFDLASPLDNTPYEEFIKAYNLEHAAVLEAAERHVLQAPLEESATLVGLLVHPPTAAEREYAGCFPVHDGGWGEGGMFEGYVVTLLEMWAEREPALVVARLTPLVEGGARLRQVALNVLTSVPYALKQYLLRPLLDDFGGLSEEDQAALLWCLVTYESSRRESRGVVERLRQGFEAQAPAAVRSAFRWEAEWRRTAGEPEVS